MGDDTCVSFKWVKLYHRVFEHNLLYISIKLPHHGNCSTSKAPNTDLLSEVNIMSEMFSEMFNTYICSSHIL